MGYDTKFKGSFKLDRPLTIAHANELNDINEGASSQREPSPYCHWKPAKDGAAIEWNQDPRFCYTDHWNQCAQDSSYIQWIAFIVANYLAPWGYTVNGNVDWRGADFDDCGRIKIVNNVVTAKKATISYD